MGVIDWSSAMIGFIAGAGFVVIIILIAMYKDSADWLKRFEQDHKQRRDQSDQPPISDDLLWQEIYSLREKLKITVEAIKSYDPEFDAQLFTHQLNSVDYDQLMEELSEDEQKEDI